jgi:hypothetical protein
MKLYNIITRQTMHMDSNFGAQHKIATKKETSKHKQWKAHQASSKIKQKKNNITITSNLP